MGEIIETREFSPLFYLRYLKVDHVPYLMRNPEVSDDSKIYVLRVLGCTKELIRKYFHNAEFHCDDKTIYHNLALQKVEPADLPTIQTIVDYHYRCSVIITNAYLIRGIPDRAFVVHGSHGQVDMIKLDTHDLVENYTPEKIFEEAMKKYK